MYSKRLLAAVAETLWTDPSSAATYAAACAFRTPEPQRAALVEWTICESGTPGGLLECPSACRSGSAGTRSHLRRELEPHTHREVVANSVDHDELTAALLLPHELEHVRVLRPDC